MIQTRTEYYGTSRTPCLVVGQGKTETWVSLGKVKAVLAVGAAEAQAWVNRIQNPKPVKTAVTNPSVEALVQAEVERRIQALGLATNRIDPITTAPATSPSAPASVPAPEPSLPEAGAGPQVPGNGHGQANGKSRLAALVARATSATVPAVY